MRMFGVLCRLAWRYLWRNHRRTIIMVGAIAVGTWAMIFMTALTRGMVDQMVHDGISALPGHVQIHNPEFLDDPSIANRVALDDEQLAERFADAGFRGWASRVRVPAVITSERESRGVTLLGIDPVAERDFLFVDYDAVEGRFLLVQRQGFRIDTFAQIERTQGLGHVVPARRVLLFLQHLAHRYI